ncbi:zinc-dependent alcohol dehydrogenase [Sporobolomyces salmoneus]|uniref:zinc-dependent alcohol dehydrogenase n=1 Tax=Sporobolomyces salmoneus TaxID=183962 RepID=UPI00317EC0C3
MTHQHPKTACAMIFEDSNSPLEYKTDHPVPQQADLKPGEVLVKVEYSGVCHTDLHAWKGDWPAAAKKNLVGGHEGAGPIVAIGEGTLTNLKVGQNVGIKWLADSCLDCENCRGGSEATCAQAQCSGYSVDGSFQQYAVSYARHVTPIPDGLPLEVAAPILCAGVTVYRALLNSSARAGQFVAIVGAGGGLGHLAVQYASAMGFRVVAIDTGADKKKLCASYGADKFIDFKDYKNPEDMIKAIKAECDGVGPHAAVVAAAGAAAYEQALEYIRPTGTLVAVGLPPDTFIKANVFFTVFHSKRIVGSYVGNRQDAEEALDFALRGKVSPRIEVCPLKQLPEVYERMEKGQLAGRVVLKNF